MRGLKIRGTRIMALRLGEIIKTLIFIIAGIALVLLLVNLFAQKTKSNEETPISYIPGAYNVSLQLNKGSVEVEVVVTNEKITGVSFKNLPDDQQVFYPLLKPTMEILSTGILDSQTLDVAVPEDRCVTGQVLLSAINEALVQAQNK